MNNGPATAPLEMGSRTPPACEDLRDIKGPPYLLTCQQVADALSLDVATIYRWVKSGKIKSIRLSRKVIRIDRAELESWLLST